MYFNPRSPCGERPGLYWQGSSGLQISIHAPRVGSDIDTAFCRYGGFNFNPRSPCGERHHGALSLLGLLGFQSTLPVWGATAVCLAYGAGFEFQSTLPVWGATRPGRGQSRRHGISIHAPRVGSDLREAVCYKGSNYFNPRSPCGERLVEAGFLIYQKGFQSTLPVWGATESAQQGRKLSLFQSTLPVWGATQGALS